MKYIKNLKFDSYLIGLLQTDGTYYKHSRNRGGIVLEISYRDVDIIDKIYDEIPNIVKIRYRVRDTNYMSNVHMVILTIYNLDVRLILGEYIPVGSKSDRIFKPQFVSPEDYWRGVS